MFVDLSVVLINYLRMSISFWGIDNSQSTILVTVYVNDGKSKSESARRSVKGPPF